MIPSSANAHPRSTTSTTRQWRSSWRSPASGARKGSGWLPLGRRPTPFEQIAPITDVEVAAIVEAFLQARIAGEGAEQYLGDPDDLQHFETPFLYATSTGAPYERGEFEVEDGEIEDQGPLGGSIGLKVRLFAEGGQTVVEQTFQLEAAHRKPLGCSTSTKGTRAPRTGCPCRDPDWATGREDEDQR